MQLLAHNLGGRVEPAAHEYGHAELSITAPQAPLLAGLPPQVHVWMSHGDHVAELPPGFVGFGAVRPHDGGYWRLHPAPLSRAVPPRGPAHATGKRAPAQLVVGICGCQADWTPARFIEDTVDDLRACIGDGLVICGLSGGVDSAVAATLLHRAVGERLTSIFVDHGLLARARLPRSKRLLGSAWART